MNIIINEVMRDSIEKGIQTTEKLIEDSYAGLRKAFSSGDERAIEDSKEALEYAIHANGRYCSAKEVFTAASEAPSPDEAKIIQEKQKLGAKYIEKHLNWIKIAQDDLGTKE
ncbi:hypothetical protein ACRYWZ_20375 [Agrobacterium deltaense]|uniref:hypothetical protein n=1 Tax=Agrobacterium deltaense TaxID=1183412 RepID=UPI003D984BB7